MFFSQYDSLKHMNLHMVRTLIYIKGDYELH